MPCKSFLTKFNSFKTSLILCTTVPGRHKNKAMVLLNLEQNLLLLVSKVKNEIKNEN
jgi:hypothetical protein